MKTIAIILCTTFIQATSFAQSRFDDIDIEIHDPTVSTVAVRRNVSQEFAMFDDVRIHGSAGYVSSYQEFVNNGSRERGGTRGMSLHFGVDLFSENWIAEGAILMFPEADWGRTKIASNGFELRLFYEQALFHGITGKLGAGIGSRAFTVKTVGDPELKTPGSERSFQSGTTVFIAGMSYWPSGMLSLGAELSHHMAMSSADDPTSFDLSVRLNGHF